MDHSARRRPLLLPLLAALMLTLGACGGSSSSTLTTPSTTTTTTTTTTTALVTETFTGSIGQNGTAVHPFTVKVGGYTLLAGYTALSPASQASLGMGIGSWDGTTSTCGLNLAQNDAAKSGSTALTATATAANYCMRVYDGGNIGAGATVTYTLQVQHY